MNCVEENTFMQKAKYLVLQVVRLQVKIL